MKKILFLFLSLSLVLQSCAPSLPQYKKNPKQITAPGSFPNQNTKNDEQIDFTSKGWKEFFQDKQLVSLIETALTNNQDLGILEQEINIANNEVMARQGQYLPKFGIGAGYESERTSKYSYRGADDAAAGLPDNLRNRAVGLNATWEVDIWKKLRNAAKSSYYEYLASVEGRNYVITQLVAEITSDYYELMSLDNQLEIVGQFVKTLKEAQQVVELHKIAGRTTSLPVKRFDAEVLQNESRQFKIKQQIIVTENHLNKLLGRLPEPIARPSDKFKETPMPEIATDIPSALLANRPDLKQAALKLEAAKLNVKSVKAQFYPALNISANYGYQSFNASHFLDPSTLLYNVAGNLTAPLLNRNAIKAEYFSANNKQIEAIYSYEQTFIGAFAEVSNQLAAVKNFKEIYELKSQQTKALAESFDISNALFRAARVDYLESLLTRRDYLESQIELIEVKRQQIVSYVNLYKALGGGWREETAKVTK